MSSKEKNSPQVDPNTKKDYTSVLEKIRKRTGLLVGIVGLALVIFILESLLGSGASIFGGDEMTSIGYINGHKIDRNEFVNKLEVQINNFRQRNQGREPDESVRSQAVEGIWQQYVVQHAVMPQFEKIGIVVGEDELYEKVVVNPAQSIIDNLTDPNTGKLSEQFARPDGSLDLGKWKQAVQSVVGDQEMAVRQMEDNVKGTLYFQKFRSLVSKGLYVTKAEARESFKAQSTKMNVSFVHKSYTSVSDSSVKVTDADIEKYYKDHSYLYMNQETTRRVEYVSFNVVPSPEDLTAIEKDAQRVASDFKGKSLREDSSFMAMESENGSITIQNFDKKSMIIRDSSVFTAAPGTVFGPYNEGAYFKVYKLQAINNIADSARVRHILVGLNDPKTNQPKRNKAQAKREADSVLVLLKDKKVGFDTLVRTFSDDMGSQDNGGDYGWFDENKQFVEPFKNAGLMGTKGNISVVETDFGYHIIEVLDVSKTKHVSYKVAQIFKPIAPSDETNQKIFNQASQFGGENNTGDLFDKGVETQKLSKRLADNVREGEYRLPGLEGAKEMVKWAFTAKKGDVSVFSLSDKHIVAKLSGIRDKGVLPLEEVKEEVTLKAREQKKAELFLAEFNKAGAAGNIDALASKLGVQVMKQEDLKYDNASVNGLGRDNILVGTAAGTKQGAMSKPTAGNTGVFALTVNKTETSPEPKDFKEQITGLQQGLKGRSDYQSFNAIKELADIDDHKSRID